MIVSLVFALDIVVFNTAVVFVTGGLGNVLRSAVLTMIGYVSLAIALIPAWIAVRPLDGTGTPLERILTSLSLSVGALTTAGPGGSLCLGEKILAAGETFIGIYFLAVIVAGYVSWVKGAR